MRRTGSRCRGSLHGAGGLHCGGPTTPWSWRGARPCVYRLRRLGVIRQGHDDASGMSGISGVSPPGVRDDRTRHRPGHRAAYRTFAVIGVGPTRSERIGQVAELPYGVLPRDYLLIDATSQHPAGRSRSHGARPIPRRPEAKHPGTARKHRCPGSATRQPWRWTTTASRSEVPGGGPDPTRTKICHHPGKCAHQSSRRTGDGTRSIASRSDGSTGR